MNNNLSFSKPSTVILGLISTIVSSEILIVIWNITYQAYRDYESRRYAYYRQYDSYKLPFDEGFLSSMHYEYEYVIFPILFSLTITILGLIIFQNFKQTSYNWLKTLLKFDLGSRVIIIAITLMTIYQTDLVRFYVENIWLYRLLYISFCIAGFTLLIQLFNNNSLSKLNAAKKNVVQSKNRNEQLANNITSLNEQLKDLSRLKKSGVFSDDEYRNKEKLITDKIKSEEILESAEYLTLEKLLENEILTPEEFEENVEFLKSVKITDIAENSIKFEIEDELEINFTNLLGNFINNEMQITLFPNENFEVYYFDKDKENSGSWSINKDEDLLLNLHGKSIVWNIINLSKSNLTLKIEEEIKTLAR